ncbi:BadF/BadG/BcrA/BcrD ATPase family protein [Treponema sp. OMZ 790]|uniref:BadF/BadG/BcrA/BcrD ATPase family protein n=1 Tax=Treponema sp. OMZ 790 TaxID=2563665 RepID=UPI003531EA44
MKLSKKYGEDVELPHCNGIRRACRFALAQYTLYSRGRSLNCRRKIIPHTDVIIELGGEDAKITYFEHANIEQRMNGTCAGGTGSFIDQMAALLETDALGLNELAKNAKTIYPIAARCGVFAKTDVQPLINEGQKRRHSSQYLQAVVSQTISGLACGKPIRGKVAFGRPLTFWIS